MAEELATHHGHHVLAFWLAVSRRWSMLHHLEYITDERARAILRYFGADADTGDPTPRDRAKALCSTGTVAAGSAAHVVLEWGAPWKRTTHKFYPPEVRARVAVLMRVAQAIKRGKAAYEADGVRVDFAHPVSVADVFEAFVMPHMVTRDYQPAVA